MLPLTEFLVPATEALFPGFAAAQVQGTDPMQMAPKIAVALVMVLAPVAIVLSAAAGDVVMVLLGGQWAAATVPMAIFAATAIFAPIGCVCNTALVARGRVRANFIPIAVMMLPKVIVIWLAARTGSLAIVAAANVALLAIETSLFVIILHQQGVRLAEAAKGMLRGIVAIVATMGLLYETGLGWQLGTRPVLAAFLHGLGIGVLVCHLWCVADVAVVGERPAGGTRGVRHRPVAAGYRRAEETRAAFPRNVEAPHSHPLRIAIRRTHRRGRGRSAA
jgi:O-antigen/teichoic acid export membrane protein